MRKQQHILMFSLSVQLLWLSLFLFFASVLRSLTAVSRQLLITERRRQLPKLRKKKKSVLKLINFQKVRDSVLYLCLQVFSSFSAVQMLLQLSSLCLPKKFFIRQPLKLHSLWLFLLYVQWLQQFLQVNSVKKSAERRLFF